jgi:hypothetical protein
MNLTVYVPIDDSVVVPGFSSPALRGVALVAYPQQETLHLAVCAHVSQRGHRESCFADKIREAAGTLLKKWRTPTVTVVDVPAADYCAVAVWDDQQGQARILPGRQQQLARWLGKSAYRNDLEASDSAANVRQQGRQDMRRAYLSGRPDQAQRIAHEHGLRHW